MSEADTISKRMQRLIQDLLIFAEVGINHADMEDVSLNHLLQEVLNDLEVTISERDAVIQISDLGCIKGNSLHLQQLFQNLISNSIKYSRLNVLPHISIHYSRVQGKDAGFSLIDYAAGKDYWRIEVEDNGQGFDQ